MKYSHEARSLVAGVLGSALSLTGCWAGPDGDVPGYPISGEVVTTRERTIAFPRVTGLQPSQSSQVASYAQYGYGAWDAGAGLPLDPRAGPATSGIMPAGYDHTAVTRKARLVSFFAMSDIHMTDKESPAQLIYLQQLYYPTAVPGFGNFPWGWESSVYSPVMLYTTQVLDAAFQTVNALHRKPGGAFDFGLSLGDVANSTQYNELRWFIDTLDGKIITPSSGAHAGQDAIDYQRKFKAAGLDRSIPFYSTLGNHDHFFIGSLPVDPFLRAAYVSDTILSAGDVLLSPQQVSNPLYYMGTIDGTTPLGDIVGAGRAVDFASPPRVVADPDRRSLLVKEWVQEWFNSESLPAGHGFGLVEPGHEPGFACYSFIPRSDLPLKVIVLDDTQRSDDGDTNIHGHGFLDPVRLAWLKKELAAGDLAGQLMVISAHIPIGVEPLGSNLEWWDNSAQLPPHGLGMQNAVTLQGLLSELQSHPNLLLWISGHLHQNTVNAFPGPSPEQGFWEVQVPSLRDFPQEFRTFEISLNSDYTISIDTVDVDPAVAEGTPAATSRRYAVAAQQIGGNPTIYQAAALKVDPVTQTTDGGLDATVRPMPTGSYNATLYKQLTPAMKAKLQGLFP